MADKKELRLNPLDWDLENICRAMLEEGDVWEKGRHSGGGDTRAVWCGVDEAGRGAWAGPVVAAAVALTRGAAEKWGRVLRSARDSKMLKPEKRAALALELKAVLPSWAVAAIDNEVIDRINILEATKAAMRQAIHTLKMEPGVVLIDGDHAPGSDFRELTMVDGDEYSCSVACASILAKTHRDALMLALGAQYPEYGFARHKGYGTKEHRAALARHGPCAIHRMSYEPVKAGIRE